MPSELEQRGYSLLVALPLRQGSWAKVTLERSLARSVGPISARRGRSPGGRLAPQFNTSSHKMHTRAILFGVLARCAKISSLRRWHTIKLYKQWTLDIDGGPKPGHVRRRQSAASRS